MKLLLCCLMMGVALGGCQSSTVKTSATPPASVNHDRSREKIVLGVHGLVVSVTTPDVGHPSGELA